MQRAVWVLALTVAFPRPAQAACPDGGRPQPEVCDCIDNDCDGKVDEDPDPIDGSFSPICERGKACVATAAGCQCLAPCRSSGFSCSVGYQCIEAPVSGQPGNSSSFCVLSACRAGANPCDGGSRCVSNDGVNLRCEPTCTIAGCDGGKECVQGHCIEPPPPVVPPPAANQPDARTSTGGSPSTADAGHRVAHEDTTARAVS